MSAGTSSPCLPDAAESSWVAREVEHWRATPQPGREQKGLSGHTDGISALAAVPGTPFLVSASDDGKVRVWDVEAGNLVRGHFEGHIGPVTAVSVSPDGMTIATAGKDRTVRLWDVPTGAPLGL
jgi:WD40 repeat protein